MRAAILAPLFLLGGCGVIFPYESTGSCPQTGTGVCASVRTVYGATNKRDHVEPGDLAPAAASGESAGAGAVASRSGGRDGGIALASSGSSMNVLPVSMDGEGVLPLRSPSEIMRIWVAPWEADSGDLNMSGYVFTELRPRRWQVGPQAIGGSNGLKPIEVPSSPGLATASAAPAQPPPANRPAPPIQSAPPPIAAERDASRPVIRASAGVQPQAPAGPFWQTDPGTAPVQ